MISQPTHLSGSLHSMNIAILDFNQTEQNHSYVSSLLIKLFKKQAVDIHVAIGKLAMVLLILSKFLKLQLHVDE